MKRIITSLSLIAAVGVFAVGGTIAFFSDTETSTGNTFSVGGIDLDIGHESYFNEVASASSTWNLADLDDSSGPSGSGQYLYYNISDVMPGDRGAGVVELQVTGSDSYACVVHSLTEDHDNGLTDAEAAAGDATGGDNEGELADELMTMNWIETDGDGVYEDNEILVVAPTVVSSYLSTASDLVVAISDTSGSDAFGGTPLAAGTSYYLGTAVCHGTLAANAAAAGSGSPTDPNNNGFTCDGSSATNLTQGDNIETTIEFYAEQSQNNDSFLCSSAASAADITDSYSTGFEPSAYLTGNIDGQDGWKKTGSFDAEVIDGPVIEGVQSLRISNAVTSGSFGDQTFAPELAEAAGESSIASNNYFEAEFEISSTQLTEQSGLAISVSPDNGSGSRMSYLGFADESTGIRVTFYDASNPGPLGAASSFSPTDLGVLDRSTANKIKFVMEFVDGAANDVVKIYINDVLVHTGTSWEDYYRYDTEQSGNGNVLFPVDTLIFRAAGTAAPGTSGKGFLFDNVTLSSGTI